MTFQTGTQVVSMTTTQGLQAGWIYTVHCVLTDGSYSLLDADDAHLFVGADAALRMAR